MARSARRAMLLSHYGIGEGGGGGGAGRKKEGRFDMDGTAFDADAAFERLVANKGAAELVEENNKLQQEVVDLDSNMQSLVYDNYNKFIDATDTIRQMKGKVESMESEMGQLEDNVARITGYADSVHGSLNGNQEKIRQLSAVHSLVKKLQFLFELPARLRSCIEMEAYSQAVRYYRGVSDILSKYADLGSFATIAADCAVIIDEIKQLLRQRLKDTKSPDVARECIDLLLELNEDEMELRLEYLALQKPLLKRNLERIIDSIDNLRFAKLLNYLATAESAAAVIESLNDGGVDDDDEIAEAVCAMAKAIAAGNKPFTLASFCAVEGVNGTTTATAWQGALRAVGKFEPSGEDSSAAAEDMTLADIVGRLDALFVPQFRTFLSSFTALFLHTADKEVEKAALVDLETATEEMFGLVFAYLKSLLSQPDYDASDLIDALFTLYRDIEPLAAAMPTGGLRDSCEEVVSKALHAYVDQTFDDLHKRVELKIEDLAETVAAQSAAADSAAGGSSGEAEGETEGEWNGGELVTELSTALVKDAKAVLKSLKPFFSRKHRAGILAEHTSIIATSIHVNIQQFILFVGSTVLELSESAPSSMSLLLTSLCLKFKAGPIIELVNETTKEYPLASGMRVLNLEMMTNDMAALSVQLLGKYVTMRGREAAAAVRSTVDCVDWLAVSGNPSGVGVVGKAVFDFLQSVARETQAVFPTSEPSPAVQASGKARPRGGGADRFDRVFAEPLEIFGPVEPNKYSILTGVMKVVLKTVVECVRLHSFSGDAFKQVHLDTQYLRTALLPYVDSLNALELLLEMVVSSLENVSVSADPLDDETIETLLGKTGNSSSPAGGVGE